MRLIERRIGLLFAGFLLVFSFAIGRAFWLQGVQGGEPARGGAQPADRAGDRPRAARPGPRPQRQGARRLRGRGDVSPRRTRSRTRAGRRCASTQCSASPTATCSRSSRPRARASPTSPGRSTCDVPRGSSELELPGHRDASRQPPHLPAGRPGRAGDRRRRHRKPGPDRARGRRGQSPRRRGGEQDIVNDALGEPIRWRRSARASDGEDIQLTLDAAIQAQDRAGARRSRRRPTRQGRHGDRHGPEHAEILAMANWPGFDPDDLSDATEDELENRATGFTYEPGSTFKAFTVAAALEDNVVTPELDFYLPPRSSVADRTIEEAEPRPPMTLTVAQILAQSSNVGAVDDRPRGRAPTASTHVDPPLRLRPPDRHPVPGRGARHRARAATNTRARRWATCRSARASR